MWSDDDDYYSIPYYFGSNDDMDDDSDDHYTFEDDYYYSSGEDYSDVISRRMRSKSDDTEDTTETEASTSSYQVSPLQDLCCRFIARRFPFAFIEHRSPPIPDQLQLKIIHFSFPEDEEMIRKYAEFSRTSVDFVAARRLVENGSVKDLSQIGFRLSASVGDRRQYHSRVNNNNMSYVTIHFDRGKITSAHCSCELSTNWCVHVVATCLARIKKKDTIAVHMPISDSLNLLDREQLLKFAQYLLSEHQHEHVVETAQQLLNRLLSRQQQDQQDDINKVAGAPDPTAGPGLDEEAHWFVSKSGFQSRCDSLKFESQADLGFVSYNDRDNERGSSVTELWTRNCFQQALVQDEMDQQLNDYCTYSSSRRLNVLKVLETVADLLEDDFMSAVSALTMCTEQLIERLNKICHVDSPSDPFIRRHVAKQQRKENTETFFGSLAGGFTPRISSCSTLSDEVSRLWRLTVLRPGVPPKQREGMIDQLRTLNQTVSAAFMSGPLRPWHGLEVAVRLASIDWGSDVFQRVLRGEWIQFPVVTSCMAIQVSCQLKDQHVNWMEEGEQQNNEEQCRASRTLSFLNPHCISFSPHCVVDIHSVCSMIEALNISRRHDEAMCLIVTLCSTLVLFYKGHLLKQFDAATLPISARCHLGVDTLQGDVKRGGDHQAGNNTEQKMDPPVEINGESPMNVDAPREKPNCDGVWPENTILSITTFAFLFDLLSRKPDLAQECLAKMNRTLSDEIRLHALDSAQSLRFYIGVIGLLLQRLPAPSLHHEVEEYNYECWLTYQLICSFPDLTDLNFLAHLGQRLIGAATTTTTATPTTTLTPPSSLARVIFHHLFKGAPAALSKSLTEQQNVGLGTAFHVLRYVNEYTLRDRSPSWMLFQYANCRLWAKLADVVLRSLSDSPELLEKAMTYILQPSGMLGARILEGTSNENIPFEVMSRLRNVEDVTAKCRVAYCLAKALSSKQSNTIKMMEYKAETGGRQLRRESVEMEMPRKILKASVGNALKLCAVQIGAHSLYLEKLSDRTRVHSDLVRWLADFVVSSGMDTVKGLLNCNGGVTLFLAQSELLGLCEKVLQKFDHSSKDIVQSILLSLLEKASDSQKLDDMKKIVSFCRDKKCAAQVDLLPWICQRLKSLTEGEAFLPFEVLMEASQGMFDYYKEKLSTQENLNRRIWSPKGKLGLRRLFSDEGQMEDDSDNEDSDSFIYNRNPYKTLEPHPYLQMAFDLGMMGLEKLKERPDERENDRYSHYRRCPVKENLTLFCRVVCYLVEKTWLTEAPEIRHKISRKTIRIWDKSRKKADKIRAIPDDKPGCSHWEDARSQNVSQKSSEDSYLHKFACSLISNVEDPMLLFDVVKEFGECLSTEGARSSSSSRLERHEKHDAQIKEACQIHSSVKLLLERAADEFYKLLTGPKMATAVAEVTHHRDRRRLETSEMLFELKRSKVMNTNMTDLLRTSKRAFNILDPSEAKIKDLAEEISRQHPILQPLLDHVLEDKEIYSSEEREMGLFRSHPSFLPALVAHGLFPGMFERNYLDDYF